MSGELRIRPIVHSGGVTLMITGDGLPSGGEEVPRQPLVLDETVLEQFRRTQLTQSQLTGLSNQITDWLLDAKVRGILDKALRTNGGLRLVVVIPDSARPMLAQLPFELLWHDNPGSPLVLRNDVQSLVYLLSKTSVESEPAIHNWPFKALIVRARPVDLDDVPEVNALANDIRALGAHYGPGMVQIDVLSSEPAVGGRATWEGLQEQLKKTTDYNILVYLGHGELISTEGSEPSGHLFMESRDGFGHEPVSAAQFAGLLSRHPIGMVLLAGCLTGTDLAGPERKRGGELGVGQALVNSSEGSVQVAVAMRTELRTRAATRFIKSFFESLFDVQRGHAGNVDHAVRAARRDLFLDAPHPPQWAAPIVMRATEKEPFIDFLATPAQFNLTDEMDMLLAFRSTIWNKVADYSLAAGESPQIVERRATLEDLAKMIREEGLTQGALLLPRDAPIAAGARAYMMVELAGTLAASLLRGRVTASDGGWVRQISAPPGGVAGFQLLTDPTDPGWFELRSEIGNTVIPQGGLLRVDVEVPPGTQSGVYPLRVEVIRLDPAAPIWPGDAVVIVPRP